MEIFTLKKELVQKLSDLLGKKADTIKEAIQSAKEARNNDTKSSAGDKYETGRAMMQFEIEKNELQLNKILKLKKDLSKIDPEKKSSKAEFGSMVETNRGVYFISIGWGKIEIQGKEVFVISPAAPIGKMLLNKQVGNCIDFQGKEVKILNVF